ncbi:MAG: hypothetical protein IID05_09995 [Gemmatimonadetes bacterium]|nr:hypothetical protein [Gemmatimonadota bacterium]
MNRRALGFAAVVVPAAALLALLAWAQIGSGGVPGGLGINETFGEITVAKGTAPPLALPLLGGGSIELAELANVLDGIDILCSGQSNLEFRRER